jgi:tetratricopeptide (TPR) repeat protein
LRRPLTSLVFIHFCVLFWHPGAYGSDEERWEQENQINLADHFLNQGEHFRAITEYKRFLYHFSNSPRAEEAHFKIGKAFFRGGRYGEAISSLQSTIQRFPEGAYRLDAKYLMGRCWMGLGKWNEARKALGDVARAAPPGKLNDMARLWLAQSYIEQERWEEATKTLKDIDIQSPLRREAEIYVSVLEEIESIPQKSPETAGVLAIIPGAGHLYCNRPKDALVAFLLNAAFIAGTIEAFRKDHKVLGGVLAAIEVVLYAGNIFSAVSSAHKFNRVQKKKHLDRIRIKVGSTSDQRGGTFVVGFTF